jgi:hypothetical protein
MSHIDLAGPATRHAVNDIPDAPTTRWCPSCPADPCRS